MNKGLIMLLFLVMGCTDLVHGQVATGGAYTLDRSLASATVYRASNSSLFSLTGSLGEGFVHAEGDDFVIAGPLKRIYNGFLEPLKVDPSISYAMSINGGDIEIAIPGNVIAQPYEAMIEKDPTNNPIATSISIIQQATQQLARQFGPSVNSPAAAVGIRILLEDNSLLTDEISQTVSYTLRYTDRGDGGKVSIYRLDESRGEWIDAGPESSGLGGNAARLTPKQGANILQFTQNSFGIFSIFQQGPTDTSRTYAFPVPWRPNANQPALFGTLQDGITFTHIPAVGWIGIYSIAGEMVRDIVIPPGSTQLRWDGKTGAGNDVASGVYLWAVESDDNRKTGKLMIIR